jgi:transcriptional regulator with XRE-family HTH domain
MAFDKAKFKKKMRANGFTQKTISEMLDVDIRTVSRWLDPKISLSSEKIATLCDLIGEAPGDFDPNWQGNFSNTNQARVSAKISSASKNGYWLMRKLYNVSEKDILEIAPTMFALLVDAMKVKHSGEDKRYEAISVLAKQYGFVPEDEAGGIARYEQPRRDAIKNFTMENKILGGEYFDEEQGYNTYVNPFMDFLSELNENSVNAKVSTVRSDELSSRGTAYNISLTNDLTENNIELNEAIASGEIELFSKEFEQIPTNNERLAWMKLKLNGIKEKKRQQREEIIKRYPKRKELYESIDENRMSKAKLKWNSF